MADFKKVWEAINIVADGEQIETPVYWVDKPEDYEIKDIIIEACRMDKEPEVLTYDKVECKGIGKDTDIHFFARTDYGINKFNTWEDLYRWGKEHEIEERDLNVYIGKWYYNLCREDCPTTDQLQELGLINHTLEEWLNDQVRERENLKHAVMLESIKNTKTEEYLKKQSKADQKVIQQLHNKNKKLAEEVMKLKEKTKWCLSDEMIESTSADSIEEFEADVRDNWKELEKLEYEKKELRDWVDRNQEEIDRLRDVIG